MHGLGNVAFMQRCMLDSECHSVSNCAWIGYVASTWCPLTVTLIGVQCMGHLDSYRSKVVSRLEHGRHVVPMHASSQIEGIAHPRKEGSEPLIRREHCKL